MRMQITIGGLMAVVVVAAVSLKAHRLYHVNTVLGLGAILTALLIWEGFTLRRLGRLPTRSRWGVAPWPRTIGVAILFGIGSGSTYLIVQRVVDHLLSAPGSPADGKGGGLFGAWIILTLTAYRWAQRTLRARTKPAGLKTKEPIDLEPPT